MSSEERDNNILYIPLGAYGIAITLTMIRALFFLEVHRAAPYRVPYFLEQFFIALLHFQVKMQLNAIPCAIAIGSPHVYIEASFAIRKPDDIVVADCRKCPFHASSIT